MRGKLILLFLICLAVLVGLAYRFAPSQASPAKAPSRAIKLFQQALPHLEEALGYRLPVRPEFRLVESEEFQKLPSWETNAYISWRFASLSKSVRQNAYNIAHHAESLASPARFIEGTKTIVVAPDHLKTLADAHESFKAANSDAFLQLAIVYEATLLALEKRHDLLHRRHDPHSLEEFQIHQTLRQGRAQWITWRVAQRLKTDSLYPLLALRWRHLPDFAPDAQLKSVSQAAFQQKYWACVKGWQFFAYLEQQKIDNLESKVFSHPPRQTTWITDPRLYIQHGLNSGPALRQIFADIEEKHSPAGLKSRQQPWTPAMLHQVAGLLGMKERAKLAMKDWQDGRSLLWLPADQSGRYQAITAVKFSTGSAARAYFGFAIDLQRVRDKLSAKSPSFPVRTVSSRFTPIELPEVDEVVRNDKIVQHISGGAKQSATIVLARSGNTVFEVQWQGLTADVDWGRRLIIALQTK